MSDSLRYCCEHRCFSRPATYDEVDGLACKYCQSYGSCRCGCVTYMRKRQYKINEENRNNGNSTNVNTNSDEAAAVGQNDACGHCGYRRSRVSANEPMESL